MINCICVDNEKKSRETIERMIKKINGLRMVRTCAHLNTAVDVWKKQDIHILFIRLNNTPVPEKDIALMQKIKLNGTSIIVLSSKMKVARDILTFNITNFVNLPTSSRQLWKASMKALKIKDFGIEIPERNMREPDETRISINN